MLCPRCGEKDKGKTENLTGTCSECGLTCSGSYTSSKECSVCEKADCRIYIIQVDGLDVLICKNCLRERE